MSEVFSVGIDVVLLTLLVDELLSIEAGGGEDI